MASLIVPSSVLHRMFKAFYGSAQEMASIVSMVINLRYLDTMLQIRQVLEAPLS